MNNKDIFANNLKKQMELKGVSRNDICQALGISYFTVSDWVNGKKYPRMDKIEKLAEYFGIPKSDLIEEHKVVYVKNKVSGAKAKNIKTFREEAGIPIIEFANLLNVDEETVLDIENGKLTPSKELLFRICDVLHTTPDFLDGTIVELLEDGDSDAEYRYSRQQMPSPENLTEGEQVLLNLFRRVPEEQQQLVLQMIRAALGNQG